MDLERVASAKEHSDDVCATTSSAVPVEAVAMTPKQSKRLRWYFEQGAKASRSSLDSIDLDLAGMGLITVAPPTNFGSTAVTLTPAGISMLHAYRQGVIAARSPHHELGQRLAVWLRSKGRITWENVEFKTWLQQKAVRRRDGTYDEPLDYGHWEVARPDVFSILPSLRIKYAKPHIHEVKVSRADFLADIANPGKRTLYAAMAERVYYVAAEGLILPSEIPAGFGLVVETSVGEFKEIVKSKRHAATLQETHFLNMVVKPGTYPDNYSL